MDMTTAVSESLAEMLAQPGVAGAAADGQVHILDVGAIRNAVGARWGRQEELVRDFVLRAFARNALDDDFIAPVNAAQFVLVQPGRPAMGALSRASQILRETLTYFLGEAKTEDVHISIVDRVGRGGALEATRIDAARMADAVAIRWSGLGNSMDGSPPWQRFGVERPAPKVVRISRPDGDDIEASFYLDPVWHVSKAAVVSFVVRTIAVQRAADGKTHPLDPANLTPRTAAAVVMQRLAFVRETLEIEDEQTTGWIVHVPIPIDCLSYSGARTLVTSALSRLADDGRRARIVVEISAIGDSPPHSRLVEAVSLVKPYARNVLLHVPPLASDLRPWSRCGAAGVVKTLDDIRQPAGEKTVIARLPEFVETARRLGLVPGLDGICSRSMAIAAWSAGFTHLSGDAVAARFGCETIARRFAVCDLYETTASRETSEG